MKLLVVLALVVAVNAINYECSNANLNVRSGAGTSYSINWVANNGDKFQVLATNGVWHQVKAASGARCGNVGWAHSDYLASCSGTGDCNNPAGPVSSGPSAGSYVTPNNALNIRTGASTSNSVQWVAQPGEVFQVISSSNGWSSLRAASGTRCGTTGYASSQYLVASASSSCSSNPTPPPSTSQYPLYKQCNSAWGGNALGNSGGETICTAGCAMSSVAMALTRYGANYNPGQLNDWLKSHSGYASGNLIVWGAVRSLGLSAATGMGLTSDALASTLAAGKPVIANVNSGGHWVLVTGNAGGGNFYVNDPGYTRSTYAFSAMMPGRFVVYTPVTATVRSVQASPSGEEGSEEVPVDSSEDETDTQVFERTGADGARELHIVHHSAEGQLEDVFPIGDELHQDVTAPISVEVRLRLRRRGQGHLLVSPNKKPSPVSKSRMRPRPVQIGKSKNGPKQVQIGKSKNGPKQVQIGKMRNGPKSVMASKQKGGPKQVMASKQKGGPKQVQSGRPKHGNPGPVQGDHN